MRNKLLAWQIRCFAHARCNLGTCALSLAPLALEPAPHTRLFSWRRCTNSTVERERPSVRFSHRFVWNAGEQSVSSLAVQQPAGKASTQLLSGACRESIFPRSQPEMNAITQGLEVESQQSQASLFASGSEPASSLELFSQPVSLSCTSQQQHSQNDSSSSSSHHLALNGVCVCVCSVQWRQ